MGGLGVSSKTTSPPPVLLPVIARGRKVVGVERANITRQILAAADSGESPKSIGKRMGRSRSWVAAILYEAGYVTPLSRFRGPARIATGFAMSGQYHKGASVEELMVRWNLKGRRTVLKLLAEWEIDARNSPRPSEQWRRAHLPPDVMPADLTAEPSPEEWLHVWTYLSERREAGALITKLVGETGLNYRTVQHGLTALRVQPDRQ
jgi:hypothetical protein